MAGWYWVIDVLQVKYLNNVIKQDHRFIKKLTRPLLDFRSFASAQAALAGIETAQVIRKDQLTATGDNVFQRFVELAG